LARLSVTDAKLWVLDEPFVALDTQSLDNLRALLANHVQKGGMLLYTSHQSVELSQSNGHAMDVHSVRLVAA
jgi:heme exporter protein A